MKIRAQINGAKNAIKFAAGYIEFALTGRTAGYAHQAMIQLFLLSGGKALDLLNAIISKLSGQYKLPSRGLLGDMSGERLKIILNSLQQNGYYVFEDRLGIEACDELLNLALNKKVIKKAVDGEGASTEIECLYNRDTPAAVRYELKTEDLLNHKQVQKLLADNSILSLAQSYLGAIPKLDVLASWWHTAYSKQPDKNAAQFFHFDMDRPKWLKFFIYVTDVKTENGPHSFISGTHRSGMLPQSILDKGYARLDDGECEAIYGHDKIIEFCGPRGTIIAEDTRGLHKGKHVQTDDRLVFQIQYSNSLFGAAYPKCRFSDISDVALLNAIKKFPKIYSQYI